MTSTFPSDPPTEAEMDRAFVASFDTAMSGGDYFALAVLMARRTGMTPQAHLDLCKRYYPSAVPDAAWSDDGRD